MSSEQEDGHFNGARLLRICLIVVGIGGLVALCIWVTVQRPSQFPEAEASPTPSPTSIIGEDDTLETIEGLSDSKQPTDAEIWAFETAYVTADPAKQLELLQKIATPQYISNEYSATSIDVDELEVKVDRPTSSFAVERDSQNTHCFITSFLNLNSFRRGEHVLSYSIQHTTIWVNTKDGWKVASEMR